MIPAVRLVYIRRNNIVNVLICPINKHINKKHLISDELVGLGMTIKEQRFTMKRFTINNS